MQTENIPSMYESKRNGCVTTAFNDVSIADGISVKTPGNLTFEIVNELVDEIIVVTEDEIKEAMIFLMENQKLVAEGSGAVTTAGLLSKKYMPKADENVVCIISGGNVDMKKVNEILNDKLK